MCQYNDNELLYLIYEKEDAALEVIFDKYKPMILRRIKEFKVVYCNYDDFYQEGLLMLKKAVETFDSSYNKTFNRYFDLILQRRFIRLVQNEKDYNYNITLKDYEFFECFEDTSTVKTLMDIDCGSLSRFERQVFEKLYKENKEISKISDELGCNVECIYNASARAKKKLRKKYL